MIRIREAIIVEGRYDKNTLAQIVDAPILETSGFGIFHDRQRLALLRRLAETRGIIVLTDSDGAGFVIRNYLRGAIDPSQVKHAYIPDIAGKERRKRAASKEGKLGVEGMRPDVLLEALRRAGATIEGEETPASGARITKADLYAAGLTGGPPAPACTARPARASEHECAARGAQCTHDTRRIPKTVHLAEKSPYLMGKTPDMAKFFVQKQFGCDIVLYGIM